MKLVFVRHGESEGNAEGRLQGHAEFELSEEGRSQSQKLRDRFQKEDFQPTHIYSSPQQRAAETARIVASSWSVPIVHWDDLKEYDVGIFSGLTWDEIGKKYPEVRQEFQKSRDWDIVEGAEPLRSRCDRARRAMEAVTQRHANEDSVLIFTHGGILEYMVAALMGTERTWAISVPNTAVFEFTLNLERWSLDGDGLHNPFLWRIMCFNDASHLA
jgi:broad specificity phosphatase PhoE